jgi:arylformamidase
VEHRVQFDFEIDFSNGGGIQGQGFRLDIDGSDIADDELAAYIVRDLRLLMVGEVRILEKVIIEEPHKRRSPVLVDLSHAVEDGMVTYKGLPAPMICDFLSHEASREVYAPGTEFQIGTIELCSNTGTYVDSPFHRYRDGADLAALPLELLADLDAVVVEAGDGREVGPDAFDGVEVRGRAVLVRTGWDRHWRTDAYFEGHPFLTGAAAERLLDAGALFVGIDSLNIDDIDDGTRPVHTALLGAGVPICEHMTNLLALPRDGFRFSAVPVKVHGMGTFPVRAYARL